MLEVPKVNAMSLISLIQAIEAAHSAKRRIHVFLDNASYHHALIVRDWLKRPGARCVLHFIPSYCPQLDPIERCWGMMHHHVTHNRDYKTFREFQVGHSDVPQTDNTEKMAPFPRSNHRQFPGHISRRFSGYHQRALRQPMRLSGMDFSRPVA